MWRTYVGPKTRISIICIVFMLSAASVAVLPWAAQQQQQQPYAPYYYPAPPPLAAAPHGAGAGSSSALAQRRRRSSDSRLAVGETGRMSLKSSTKSFYGWLGRTGRPAAP